MRPIAVLLLIAVTATALASDPVVNDEFFENKVRPILVAECVKCHGSEKQKGGLRLDSRANMLKGGDTGPAVKPGDPAASRIIQFTRYDDHIKMAAGGELQDEKT